MNSDLLRKTAVVAVAIFAAALCAAYYFFDPSETEWMPRCLWKTLTGTDCPGCGSQRMIHALFHGDIAGAWRANAFAVCALPLLFFLFWLELTRVKHPALYARVHRPLFIWFLAGAVLAWWLLRNL